MRALATILAVSPAWATLTATDFVPYPGYSGTLEVSGEVTISADVNYITGVPYLLIKWVLAGLDIDCTEFDTAIYTGIPNGCGVHVHTGTTCSDASLVGGHFYDTALPEDPWKHVSYWMGGGMSSTTGGDTMGIADVGYSTMDMIGRALIVHGQNGGRIACGILTAPPPSTPPSTPLPAAPPAAPPRRIFKKLLTTTAVSVAAALLAKLYLTPPPPWTHPTAPTSPPMA